MELFYFIIFFFLGTFVWTESCFNDQGKQWLLRQSDASGKNLSYKQIDFAFVKSKILPTLHQNQYWREESEVKMLPEFLVTCCCNSFQRSVFLKQYKKRIWLSVSRVTRRKHIFVPYGQAVYMESLEFIQIIFHQREEKNHCS